MTVKEAVPSVRINGKAAGRIQSGHPWVFVSDVIDSGSAMPGQAVRVLDLRGRMLGTAHYSSASQIALRLLSRQAIPIDQAFLTSRIEAALSFRKLVVQDTEAYRLIHAEGDLLPGLIVDRYGDWLVAQFLDQGMDAITQQVVATLQAVLSPAGIIARNDGASRVKENLIRESKVLMGELPGPIEFSMNGLR